MRLILFFVLTIGLVSFSSISYGQDDFSYKDYFPKQEVDSVEWYYGNIPCKKDSILNLQLDKEIYYVDEVFPFENLTILTASYFEKRATLIDNSDIQNLVQVFPIDSCENYAITRCGNPIYRDILIFYKNGIAVSVLKVCFSCKATCFVSKNEEQDPNAKCLSNPLSIKEIAKEWVRRGWIDLRKGR
jgi:hypothetical protein